MRRLFFTAVISFLVVSPPIQIIILLIFSILVFLLDVCLSDYYEAIYKITFIDSKYY